MFLGIKCKMNQAMNDTRTNPSVKNLQNIDRDRKKKVWYVWALPSFLKFYVEICKWDLSI